MSSVGIEAESAMRNVISDSGFIPPDCIHMDGEIHRFDGVRQRGHKKNCWYVAHREPVPVLVGGDWATALGFKYVHASKPISYTERSLINSRIREMKEQRKRADEQKQSKAAINARSEWNESEPVNQHPYLKAKQVQGYRLRVNEAGILLIPVTDGEHIHSLQYIQPDGGKMFLPGGKVKGHFYPIGMADMPERILICEGVATGLTLYEDMQCPVIVAFNAGNLAPVAESIRWKYPESGILICGDNDHATERNPGRTEAMKAAVRCFGDWTVPDFTGLNAGPKDTDFNDLSRLKEASHE
jgi:putative DNA primase/helicase